MGDSDNEKRKRSWKNRMIGAIKMRRYTIYLLHNKQESVEYYFSRDRNIGVERNFIDMTHVLRVKRPDASVTMEWTYRLNERDLAPTSKYLKFKMQCNANKALSTHGTRVWVRKFDMSNDHIFLSDDSITIPLLMDNKYIILTQKSLDVFRSERYSNGTIQRLKYLFQIFSHSVLFQLRSILTSTFQI